MKRAEEATEEGPVSFYKLHPASNVMDPDPVGSRTFAIADPAPELKPDPDFEADPQ